MGQSTSGGVCVLGGNLAAVGGSEEGHVGRSPQPSWGIVPSWCGTLYHGGLASSSQGVVGSE